MQHNYCAKQLDSKLEWVQQCSSWHCNGKPGCRIALSMMHGCLSMDLRLQTRDQ